MALIVKPVAADLFYHAVFSEPMFDLFRSDATQSLTRNIVKRFAISIDSIRFNREALSKNFIHFSTFDGPSWFDVSYGLEEVTATIRNPQKEEQVVDLYTKLAKCFKEHGIKRQRMNILRQLSTKGDASSFLKALNPQVPGGLEGLLKGRGVLYSLTIPDHQLKIDITLANSHFVPGGLFLSIESEFSPNKYSFERAFKVAKEYHDLAWKELDLKMEQET